VARGARARPRWRATCRCPRPPSSEVCDV
jgi:hypothetical protein